MQQIISFTRIDLFFPRVRLIYSPGSLGAYYFRIATEYFVSLDRFGPEQAEPNHHGQSRSGVFYVLLYLPTRATGKAGYACRPQRLSSNSLN